MKTLRLVLTLCVVGAITGAITSTWLERRAEASRNSGGVYSLPSSVNPVVSGTAITSTWGNTTLNDVATEITNSLDRSGRGAMTAPLQLASGSSSQPALTFSSETNLGLYRAAYNDLRMQVGGSNVQKWSPTASIFPLNMAVSGTTVIDLGNAGTGAAGGPWIQFGPSSSEGITSKRTSGTGQNGIDIYTQGGDRLSVNSTGGVQVPGQFAGSPGTAITGSYAATVSLAWSLGSGVGGTQSVTVTGAAVGGVCDISAPSLSAAVAVRCYVLSANTVAVCAGNVSGSTVMAAAANHYIRVWNP